MDFLKAVLEQTFTEKFDVTDQKSDTHPNRRFGCVKRKPENGLPKSRSKISETDSQRKSNLLHGDS